MVEGEVAFLQSGSKLNGIAQRAARALALDHQRPCRNRRSPQKAPGKGRFSIARWLSMLPVISRPDSESALVIGLGAGITAAAVPKSVDEVHVVELEPEVVHANRTLADIRDNRSPERPQTDSAHQRCPQPLTSQSAHLRRHRVPTVPHPWTAGASHLFTREFFELVQSRLEPSGAFVQWIGLRFLDEDLLRSLLATLNEVFPYVWRSSNLLREAPFFSSPASSLSLDPRIWSGGYDSAKESWWLLGHPSAESVLTARRLDADASRAFGADAPVSRDLRNLFRTRSAKAMRAPLNRRSLDELLRNEDPPARPSPGGSSGEPPLLRTNLDPTEEPSPSGSPSRRPWSTKTDRRDCPSPALVAQSAASTEQARPLPQVLRTNPQAEEALAALLLMDGQAVIQGRRPGLEALIAGSGDCRGRRRRLATLPPSGIVLD